MNTCNRLITAFVDMNGTLFSNSVFVLAEGVETPRFAVLNPYVPGRRTMKMKSYSRNGLSHLSASTE